MNNEFNKWLERLLEEKSIDPDTIHFDFIDDDEIFHDMPLRVVIEYIKKSDPINQDQIKLKLVKIDFQNGDILHFFKYIAHWIVENHKPEIFKTKKEMIADGQ
ncbi:MAG: hypothetical protein BAJALOKI1v1_2240004 [Promethearchaeota archaeon]|nr:MAG: hypothetical protein BAJALOKI1v1_2240004 [Candidatus Lokiarchaeota archaeon]